MFTASAERAAPGNKGRAITLFTTAEEHSMRAIERLTGQTVERVLLPDFGGVMPSAALHRSSKQVFGRTKKSFRSFVRDAADNIEENKFMKKEKLCSR